MPSGHAGSGSTPEAPAVEHIGAYLARQRKLRGISLDDLEALTHIPRRSLERLESGVHDGDPDGFVRGFVRTVSAAIGLDAEDAVARMLAEPEATQRGRRISLRRVGMVAAAGLGLAAGLALLPGLLDLRRESLPAQGVSDAARPTPSPAPPVRWDAVRALADAQAAAPSLDGAALDPAAGADPDLAAGTASQKGSLPSPDGRDPDLRPGAALR